jgi:uncharacterized RDD family membrane protein YckC
MQSNVSLLSRIWAIIYDSLLVFSLIFALGLIFIPVLENVGDMFFYIVTIPATYLYFSLSWVKGRQTLGMKALRFQIIQINGNNISHKQAFIRFISASAVLIFIGLVYILFNKDNLSLQDKISKTILIKN